MANEGDGEHLIRHVGAFVEALKIDAQAVDKAIADATRDTGATITALFKVPETRMFLATLYSCGELFRFTPQMSKAWVKANIHKISGGVRWIIIPTFLHPRLLIIDYRLLLPTPTTQSPYGKSFSHPLLSMTFQMTRCGKDTKRKQRQDHSLNSQRRQQSQCGPL